MCAENLRPTPPEGKKSAQIPPMGIHLGIDRASIDSGYRHALPDAAQVLRARYSLCEQSGALWYLNRRSLGNTWVSRAGSDHKGGGLDLRESAETHRPRGSRSTDSTSVLNDRACIRPYAGSFHDSSLPNGRGPASPDRPARIRIHAYAAGAINGATLTYSTDAAGANRPGCRNRHRSLRF